MKKKRILTLLLAGCLTFGSVPIGNIPFNSYARTEEEIESDIEKLESEIEELNSQIAELDEKTYATEDKKELKELNNQIKDLEKQVSKLEGQLEKLYSEEPISGNGIPNDGPGKDDEKEESKEETEIVKPIKPSNTDTSNIDVKDLVVSEPIINSSSGSVRVTEIYSINNSIADCYYRPKVDDVPLLANRVLKAGKYAAAYTGFFDLNYSAANKPKGGASRALEILGYDYLLENETYDIKANKYTKIILGDEGIREETAIMNLYKALGLEMYDIKMTHEKSDYTSGSSPAATLLGKSTIVYSGGGENPIRSTDTMVPFSTKVFVSRTNPLLYMKRLSQDFNISIDSNKQSILTNADFIIMAAKMMQFYGEPEMSDNEMNQLAQVYGGDIPSGMEDELKQAWIYLKARGVLNIEDLDLYGYLSREDMLDILMRIKDKDSRVNYKDIQVTVSLDQALINQGYYPKENITITEIDSVPIQTEIDYAKMEYYDYLIPMTDYSRFKNQFKQPVSTMFVSDNPTGIGNAIEKSAYVGIEDQKYYHYKVPIKLDDKYIYNNSYVRIDTPENSDKPGAIYLQLGGGILVYDTSAKDKDGKQVNFFKRRPFLDNEYETFVDENRADKKKEFNWDSWNESNNGSDDDSDDEEDNKKEPDLDDLGFDDWQGPSLDQVSDFTWTEDKVAGKWRCYKGTGYDREMLQAGVYYLGGDVITGNPQDNMFAFDNDAYMVTGWYQEGYNWYYFDENGHMAYSTTLTIDGEEYEFDQYGRWIDMVYNIPEDYEDIWSSYDNMEGTWQLDDDRWWFMLTDGDWLFGSIFKINDKFYSFDDDGYMRTGWVEDDDHWYYFADPDGYMYINATTPDGRWCGKNGRATGEWKLSIINSPIYKVFASAFTPMTVYAAGQDDFSPKDASLTNSMNVRWYMHKIPIDMITNSIDDITGLLDSSNGEYVTKNNGYYTIYTKRSKANILSQLTLKDSSGYSFVKNTAGIANVGDEDSMLVPYLDLFNLGIFNRVEVDDKNQRVTLYAGRPDSGIGDKSTFRGFGNIVLDNANKTILVGTTIYRVSDTTTLFEVLPADSSVKYEYIDKSGTPKEISGEMLYIDFRAALGWSADNITFYRDSTGKVMVTAGKPSDRNSKVKSLNVACYVENGKKRMTVIGVYGYNRDLFLMSNMYPVANWAAIRSAHNKGSEDNKVVVAYNKKMFGSTTPPDDYQKLVELLSTKNGTPNYDGYCYRLFDLESYKGGVETIKANTVLEEGKFYWEPDFGLVYAAPTDNEWKSKGGYAKYLSGEYALPIVSKSTQFIDKSVPYIEGKEYGTTQLKNTDKIDIIHPQLAALSYLLYDKNTSTIKLNERTVGEAKGASDGLTDNSIFYFGQNRIYKGKDDNYLIDGITHYNDVASVKKKDFDSGDYMRVNLFTSTGDNAGNMLGGGANKSSWVYVNIPTEATYETVANSSHDTRKSTFTNNGVTNIFENYEQFRLNDLLKKIDESTSFIILIAMQVLPLTLFTLSMIVFLFALMGEWKAIRALCAKFFDPIEILTFGKRNIETAHGMRFFATVILTTMIFALWANGNFIRVLAWVFQFFGEYINIIHNI